MEMYSRKITSKKLLGSVHIINLDEHMYFLCPECGKGNDTEQEFWRHLNNNHDYAHKFEKELNFIKMDQFYKCLTCSSLVPVAPQGIRLLKIHSFLHLPYTQSYSCRHCCMSFTHKTALSAHLCKQHGNLLGRTARVKQMQMKKEGIISKNPLLNSEFYLCFLCPLCGSRFERFDPWLQHIDTVHIGTSADLRIYRIGNSANYFCTMCKLTLEGGLSKEQRQRHRFTHLPFPSYFQCVLCNTSSAYKSEILLHYIKAHPINFQISKEYVKLPVEWGGHCPDNVLSELHQLLNGNGNGNANDNYNETDDKLSKEINVLKEVLKNCSINSGEGGDDKHVESASTKGTSSITQSQLEQVNLSANQTESFETSFVGELRGDTTNDNPAVQDGNIGGNYNEIFGRAISLETSDNSVKDDSDSHSHPNKPTNLNKHATNYASYMDFVCQECQQKFRDSPNCQEHIMNAHKIADIEAKMRSMNMQSTSKLNETKHSPYFTFVKCAMCAKVTFKKSKMVEHLQNSHGKEIMIRNTSQITDKTFYNCLVCFKKYKPNDPRILNRKQCECGAPLKASLYDVDANNKMFNRLAKISVKLIRKEMPRKTN